LSAAARSRGDLSQVGVGQMMLRKASPLQPIRLWPEILQNPTLAGPAFVQLQRIQNDAHDCAKHQPESLSFARIRPVSQETFILLVANELPATIGGGVIEISVIDWIELAFECFYSVNYRAVPS